MEHLGKPGVLSTGYDYLSVVKGVGKMSVAIFLNGSSIISHPVTTFFISAFQHSEIVTNVAVDNQRTTSLVILGDDIYLLFWWRRR